MLTKDLLRVSRRGGYRPEFVDEDREALAARVIGTYQGHVGRRRAILEDALEELEGESGDFKLVRGFARLVERDTEWTVRAPIEPRRARRAAFDAAATAGVVTETERETALAAAADRLDATTEAVEESLYADREAREVLAAVDPRWTPSQLCEQYNLSLAQTALFDATEVRIRSSDPKRVISAIGRLGLLSKIRRLPAEERRTVGATDREIIVTGPDALFRSTRRYGTSFARLLRSVAGTDEWRLSATIDDRGTERELVLTDADLSVPGVEPIAEVQFDSDLEAEFAWRFAALDLDWELVREPDTIAAGEYVLVPDFAFDWRHGDFRVYFEIMGFWTPEYVATKLDRLEATDTELLVAVDESLGVGEEIEIRDHRAIPYTGQVPVKAVRQALRRYEDQLVEEAAAALPAELVPEADVVALGALSDRHGVSEAAIEAVDFPDHELIGRTLVRPEVLADLAAEIDAGISFERAAEHIEAAGIEDASAVLARLGYRVEWEGLSGGTIRERDGPRESDG